MYFNLGAIPPGKTIKQAKLHLYVGPLKWADGGQTWLANYQVFLAWPGYTWPPAISNYALLKPLTLEIYREYYPTTSNYHWIDVTIPEAIATQFTGKSRFCIAEKCSSDHDFTPIPWRRKTFGCHFYRTTMAGYLDVEAET